MSAMTNYTIRSLRTNRVRTFVTIAGVALAAALLTAILTSYTSLTDFLYRSEATSTGTWMACVEADNSPQFAEERDKAKNDADVTSMATFVDKGFAQLTSDQQNELGHYAPIVAAEGDLADIAAIEPSEGRLPEREHEILLYRGWQTYEDVQIGDTVSFDVGKRQAVGDGTITSGSFDGTTYSSSEFTVENGMLLNSSVAFLSKDADGNGFEEQLVDLHEESYVVVGFYDHNNYALSSALGMSALVCGDPIGSDFTRVYLDYASVSTTDEVIERTKELFPESDPVLHMALLRFMGVSSDTGIWQTFFYLVVILITIISLACISLIFNAFNISVAERMNAFALLSSVGATPAQLRRAILLEGLIIALIGIPIGIAIGIAGCAITFQALGPAIAAIANGGLVPFMMKVDIRALIVALALTLVTVIISSWIPAKRASRVNIIEALRQTSSARISKRGLHKANKAIYSSLLWRKRNFDGKVFGIGGSLARINRKRSASKGRAAAFSLAVAIVLLMTAGSLNTFLGTLVDAATGGSGIDGEANITTQLRDSESQKKIAAASNADELLSMKNEAFCEQVSDFQQLYTELSTIANARPLEWILIDRSMITLPSSMAGSAFEQDAGAERGRLDDGTYASSAIIQYLDDATFNRYANSIGQDPSIYHDPDHPRAIALSQAYGNDGEKYRLIDTLKSPGTVEVLGAATVDGKPVTDLGLIANEDDEGGASVEFAPYVLGEHDGLESVSFDAGSLDIARIPLEITALTDQAPVNCGPADSIVLIVPESLAVHQGFGITAPVFYSYFDSTDGDHATLAKALEERAGSFMTDSSLVPIFISVNDAVEVRNSNQMLATIVNVFCLLFTVILALIAMANVFNTVTNSLVLRKREFAVMRSIGLSPKQFRRMIIDECVHFGIAGLIPGLIVSLGVSFLLYAAISQSLEGLSFILPWSYLALAITMTAAIMLISVIYGLRRCKSNNVVEALRSDNI